VTPANKTKGKVLLFAGLALLVSLLLGFCGGVILMSVLKKDNNSKHEVVTSYGTASSQSSTDVSQNKPENNSGVMSKVTNYLDTHEKWNRDEMEAFQEIRGLWDALNERRFDDILRHAEQLKASTKFQELVIAINENKHKEFRQNYNSKPSDYDITIGSKDTPGSYIKKLYDANEPGSHSTGTGTQHKPDGAGKGDPGKKTSDNQDEF
jgi:hypothetical protein